MLRAAARDGNICISSPIKDIENIIRKLPWREESDVVCRPFWERGFLSGMHLADSVFIFSVSTSLSQG